MMEKWSERSWNRVGERKKRRGCERWKQKGLLWRVWEMEVVEEFGEGRGGGDREGC